MPRPIYRYQPFNETPDKAISVLQPFNKDAGGTKDIRSNYSASAGNGKGVFQSSYSTEEQAISNLKNLLLTQKGERIFQPNFGTDIQKSLFENNTLDLELELKQTLTEDINFWLPYIIINRLDVIRNIDQYGIIIKLEFSVSNIGANIQIIVFATEETINIMESDTTMGSGVAVSAGSGGGGGGY